MIAGGGATFEVGPNVVALALLIVPILTLLANGFILHRANQTKAVVEAVQHDTGEVKVVADAIHSDTVAVNTAVNHKETGMPTLVQRVVDQDEHGIQLAQDLADDREFRNVTLQAIAQKLGIEIPTSPATVAPTDVQLPT